MKALLLRLHRLLGLGAGLVLAVMGLTGAALAFEEEILRALNPGVVTVQPAGEPLAPAQLLAEARRQQPAQRITLLRLMGDPHLAARLALAPSAGGRGTGAEHYQDPYSGALLGPARGAGGLHFLEDLHRRLAAGDAGKAVTGACALLFLLMLASGLYLRGRQGGRPFLPITLRSRGGLRALHMTAGTWLLPLYLVSVLSGLYFSYDWYRNGLYRLVGVPLPPARAQGPASEAPVMPWLLPAPALEVVWQRFRATVPAYESVSLLLPQRPGQPVQILYLQAGAPHDRAFGRMDVDAGSGAVQRHEPYAARSRGARFLTTLFPLHSGSYFGLPGRLLMLAAALSLPLFALTGWTMFRLRRRRLQ